MRIFQTYKIAVAICSSPNIVKKRNSIYTPPKSKRKKNTTKSPSSRHPLSFSLLRQSALSLSPHYPQSSSGSSSRAAATAASSKQRSARANSPNRPSQMRVLA